jgi:hypothetical protein
VVSPQQRRATTQHLESRPEVCCPTSAGTGGPRMRIDGVAEAAEWTGVPTNAGSAGVLAAAGLVKGPVALG